MSSVNGIFTEAMLEEAAIEILEGLGYDYAFGPDISLGGDYEERKDYREVILSHRVKDALFKINRDIPREALDDAYRQLITFNSPMLEENNRYFHQLMTEGIEVSFQEGGNIRTKRAYIIDFENISNNEFVVVNQFTIIENEDRYKLIKETFHHYLTITLFVSSLMGSMPKQEPLLPMKSGL